MTPDVFISYPIENMKIAETVYESLKNYNIDCWITPKDVKTTNKQTKESIDKLIASRVVVLIFSKNAQDSKNITEEVHTTFSAEKHIIAFKVDDSFPKDDMKSYLKYAEWIDASPNTLKNKNKTVDNCYDLLVDNVKCTLNHWDPDGQCKRCHRMFYKSREFNNSKSLRKYSSEGLCQKCQIESHRSSLKFANHGQFIILIIVIVLMFMGIIAFALFSF